MWSKYISVSYTHLRELTKFDDALGLYKSIKKLYRDFPPYWDTRLQLNMGIIYKNKQQVKSVNHKLTKDDFNDFKITQQLFFNVYKYACSTDDVLLKLEILAELIELCAQMCIRDRHRSSI